MVHGEAATAEAAEAEAEAEADAEAAEADAEAEVDAEDEAEAEADTDADAKAEAGGDSGGSGGVCASEAAVGDRWASAHSHVDGSSTAPDRTRRNCVHARPTCGGFGIHRRATRWLKGGLPENSMALQFNRGGCCQTSRMSMFAAVRVNCVLAGARTRLAAVAAPNGSIAGVGSSATHF